MTKRYIDRDGDVWEVPTDTLLNTQTGRIMLRDEVEAFFGPLTEEDDR
ncbi:hypothetical protein [Nocardiopsis sp. CNR-923]|nr:hypothetical protein [Nocardiopsis sp. CNR-923]